MHVDDVVAALQTLATAREVPTATIGLGGDDVDVIHGHHACDRRGSGARRRARFPFLGNRCY